MQDLILDSSMWGDAEGQVYDLYRTEYKFNKSKKLPLNKHPLGKVYIRGFVPDDFSPIDGGEFKMFQFKAGEMQKFSSLFLGECYNVTCEDGLIYFEDKNAVGKYILVPCKLN